MLNKAYIDHEKSHMYVTGFDEHFMEHTDKEEMERNGTRGQFHEKS